MLGLLLGTELSSTQRDYAETAQACGKALIALINEVLDRAKIEAGKLELEAVPFDIRLKLDDVLSLFSEKSRNKGLEFSEQGHIFVKVNLAENKMSTMNGKIGTCPNERLDKVVHRSGGYNYKTLSGYEAADERNSWDNFKHLIADEEFFFGASVKKVPSESYVQVTLMVSGEDTGTRILFSAKDRIFMPFVQADSSTSRHYGLSTLWRYGHWLEYK